jgi:glycosyltransferase involved in cell wall biosynthesis
MTTLLVTPFTPRSGSGRGLRTVGVVRALARSDDVVVRYIEFDGRSPDATLVSDTHVELIRLHASRGLRRAVSYGRARISGIPLGFARGVSAELVATGLDAHEYDRVVADGPTAAAALILIGGIDGVIYNAHNFESGFRATLSDARREYGTPERLRAFERRLLIGASETWLPTQKDVREAQLLAPAAPFRYVPNVVDVSAIEAVSPVVSDRVLFVADFRYEPNVNAARFLVDEVMPAFWAIAPAAKLTLTGRGLELPGLTDPRIDVLGFVPDLKEEYARAACVVVPLLQGGGSPLKMIEAMAYGLPVVATPVAAVGLQEARPGVHFLEADNAVGLASALASACSGECGGVGQAGRALAESTYSIDALAKLIP